MAKEATAAFSTLGEDIQNLSEIAQALTILPPHNNNTDTDTVRNLLFNAIQTALELCAPLLDDTRDHKIDRALIKMLGNVDYLTQHTDDETMRAAIVCIHDITEFMSGYGDVQRGDIQPDDRATLNRAFTAINHSLQTARAG